MVYTIEQKIIVNSTIIKHYNWYYTLQRLCTKIQKLAKFQLKFIASALVYSVLISAFPITLREKFNDLDLKSRVP